VAATNEKEDDELRQETGSGRPSMRSKSQKGRSSNRYAGCQDVTTREANRYRGAQTK
jgi:hypothetical protein